MANMKQNMAEYIKERELKHYGTPGMRWGHRKAKYIPTAFLSKNSLRSFSKSLNEAVEASKKNHNAIFDTGLSANKMIKISKRANKREYKDIKKEIRDLKKKNKKSKASIKDIDAINKKTNIGYNIISKKPEGGIKIDHVINSYGQIKINELKKGGQKERKQALNKIKAQARANRRSFKRNSKLSDRLVHM